MTTTRCLSSRELSKAESVTHVLRQKCHPCPGLHTRTSAERSQARTEVFGDISLEGGQSETAETRTQSEPAGRLAVRRTRGPVGARRGGRDHRSEVLDVG